MYYSQTEGECGRYALMHVLRFNRSNQVVSKQSGPVSGRATAGPSLGVTLGHRNVDIWTMGPSSCVLVVTSLRQA